MPHCICCQSGHLKTKHRDDKGAERLAKRFEVAKKSSRYSSAELNRHAGELTLTNEWFSEQGLDPANGWLGVVAPPAYRPDAFTPGDVSTPLARSQWVEAIKLKMECKAEIMKAINEHFKSTNQNDLSRRDLLRLVPKYSEVLVVKAISELKARGEKIDTDSQDDTWETVMAVEGWKPPADEVD